MTFHPRHDPAAGLAYFRRDISKDEHYRGRALRAGREVFVKQGRDIASARREFEALSLLAAAGGEPLVPRPYEVRGRELHLELVEGIRLYDLLRLLRQVSEADAGLGGAADRAAGLLLARCLARTERIEQLLAPAAPALSVGPYPCGIKVVPMLALLSRRLGLRPLGAAERAELDAFEQRWTDQVHVPFRDATPKNIIVAVACLAIGRHPSEAARRETLADLLAHEGPAFWRTAPLFDVDFSSVEHLTTPEDDLLSLLAHEASFGPGADVPVRGQPLMSALRANPERAAHTVFVRYLRFAGRKLAYRLINAQAGATRFRHDRHGFYFETMPRLVRTLDPALMERMPATMARWSAIAAAAAPFDIGNRPAPAPETRGGTARYWQESPLELAPPLARAARP